MATYSFHRLILGNVEIGNFYCLIRDKRILFLQKCLLNSSPHFIRLLSELLNLIGCRGNINSSFSKKVCFSRTISRLKVKCTCLWNYTLSIPEAGETTETPVKRYCNTGKVPIRTQNQDGCVHTR